jgi:hypothetical protein
VLWTAFFHANGNGFGDPLALCGSHHSTQKVICME